jgi:NAD(P)-dependent dehydrogenase (short-subunit alcohol dehydrogenase family)
MRTKKNVIVVGGSTGIGKGVVDAFEKKGHTVYSISTSNCDISNPKAIDDYFDAFSIEGGHVPIDILINNAAINYTKPIQKINLAEWNAVLDTNLTSYFYIIQKCLPLMGSGAKIVNVSSIAGRSKSLVSGVHYTASKAGVIGLTRQLAQELGPIGININCVCPSQTLTPMLERSMSTWQRLDLEKNIPLRRIATIEEIVKPIMFLCSSDASYIHGACIDINGGQL